MRCTKRLPLILSVLALPLIFSIAADAKKKVQDVEATAGNSDFEPEVWQLRAHGHNHLNNNVHKKMNKAYSKKNLHQNHSKSSSSSGKAKKVSKRAMPDADKMDDVAAFKPQLELWQLRANGHHHMFKDEYRQKKQQKHKKNVRTAVKKIADKKKKAALLSKRVIKKGEQGQRVLAVVDADQDGDDESINIAHNKKGWRSKNKKSKKHHSNHEDEEHDKYDVEPADELAEDYKQRHGGKDAEEVERERKEGNKKEPKDGKKEPKDGVEPKEPKDGKAPAGDAKEPKDGKAPTGDAKEPKDGKVPTGDAKEPKDGKDGKAPVDAKNPADGKAPVDAKNPADGKAPVDAKNPKDGKNPADNKAVVPPAAVIKPAPIVPVQHMGEFLTKCNTPGQVALTFSEGPSEATTQMLEILKEAKARVTFFANATWLEYMQYAGVTRRAYTDGHLIGMTYRLPNDSSKGMSDTELKADIAKQSTKIFDLIGQYPKYVRLHDAGLKDPKLEPTMREMGYTLVGFNLDEADYKYNTREQAPMIAGIYESTFAKQADAFGRKGSYVVVGYDIPASGAAAALPDIITTVIRNEYDMVRLDGCNNDTMPYKKSPLLNDGFVGDEFSFGAAKYVHGQSPVAVQNGKAVPGKMPAKGVEKKSSASGLVSSIIPGVVGLAVSFLFQWVNRH